MANVYTTQEDTLIDAIIVSVYGVDSKDAAILAVYAANPSLAARGIMLPAGVEITLPELPDEDSATITLF